MWRVAVALILLTACADSKPRQDWVNADRIDKDSWGKPCGPPETDWKLSTLPPGEPGLSGRAWRTDSGVHSKDPHVHCSLDYDNRTGKIFSLSVRIGPVERAQADRLLGDLIIQYLPPDVQLAARAAVSTGEFLGPAKTVGDFRLEGSSDYSIYKTLPVVRLAVSLGDPPQQRYPDPLKP